MAEIYANKNLVTGQHRANRLIKFTTIFQSITTFQMRDMEPDAVQS